MTQTVNFKEIFRAELDAIRHRHNELSTTKIKENNDATDPTTALGLSGITCSGGGIRSASFCLGVLQGLQSQKTLERMDYLSTVSGGGYIGTTLTIGMSHGQFPFGRLDQESRETPEVRHLRDHSRYLLQNGLPSVITAIAIYLRGIMMNVLVMLPILLCAAGFLLLLNPDTKELVTNRFLWLDLTGLLGQTRLPFTVLILLILIPLLILYAVWVSLSRIQPIAKRQNGAKVAGVILLLAILAVLIEMHAALLRLAFEAQNVIKSPSVADPGGSKFVEFVFNNAKALYASPLVLLVLPFLKGLISKATTSASASWGDLARKVASRAVLLIAAAVVPLLLWLAMMQLAYWGTEISECPGLGAGLDCDRKDILRAGWTHAPAFLQWYFQKTAYFQGAFLSFAIAAAALFLFWPILSVNSNSLHQLYRDRLGQAFLIKRKTNGATVHDEIDYADDFKLSKIDTKKAPYHLINTALNVPGSTFANRRGRNADFFVFSQSYIGSEATGYVKTQAAEAIVDGLNIGTAMAISGAAAAPNMGMASIRPLSPTIALLNVRLGRWIRHPLDIFDRNAKLEAEKERKKEEERKEEQKKGEQKKADEKKEDEKKEQEEEEKGEHQFWRIPRPPHLLYEAFSKTGVSVARLDAKALRKRHGFVFLTDGGHIDNLGVYELLRRRCKLIIAIDGEADPDFDSGSLVQVERFARIDMNVIIKLNWEPIGMRTLAVTNEIKNGQLKSQPGPHVALGSISYPPLTAGGEREKGVLIYIKASLSGDESDYVIAYKKANPQFPHETTLDQLFSEEQFEAYRALGEHIARRFLDGRDGVAAYSDEKDELLKIMCAILPEATPKQDRGCVTAGLSFG
jgi:hypothetical protein